MKIFFLILTIMSFNSYGTSLESKQIVGRSEHLNIKVLSLNLWGLPDSIIRISGVDESKQARLQTLCENLKSSANMPDVVMLQEVWDARSANFLMNNCGYKYSSYPDDTNFKQIFNKNGVKLSNNFFTNVREEVLDYILHTSNQTMVSVVANLLKITLSPLSMIPAIQRFDTLLDDINDWVRTSSVKSGLLILSKHKITDSFRMVYTERGYLETVLSDFERSVTKSILLAKIHHESGIDFWVANTHLISNNESKETHNGTFGSDYYQNIRLYQFHEALNWVKSKANGAPFIIGGDLNTGPGYPIWPSIQLSSTDNACDLRDLDNKSTYSPRNKYVKADEGKLDHLFSCNGAVPTEEYVVLDKEPVSDHFGIIKGFNIPIALTLVSNY